jgi:L,D-transpeptidase ErfK/SrfK
MLNASTSFSQFQTQEKLEQYFLESDTILIQKDIKLKEYFKYMDSIVQVYDSITPFSLTEHLLVNANPWIIDTLKNTDYYSMKERDSFIYDQKEMIILPKESILIIPDSTNAERILTTFKKTLIDINIPEFKLRILKDSVVIHAFPIRVGRNEEKFLEMSGRLEDLKTRTGKGHIVGFVKNPEYRNPTNNKQYHVTKRDDEKTTKLPQIPFIETELNGLRYGQMIHPTTNPETLGKAYSNGCIGTNEADAWVIYYSAPINTPIVIRYDLDIMNKDGKMVKLKDIYNYH